MICRDAATGSLLWEKPLQWPGSPGRARPVGGRNRLLLSAAQSVGTSQYRLRCWSRRGMDVNNGRSMTNPVKDLYPSQQVKRPVVLRTKVV